MGIFLREFQDDSIKTQGKYASLIPVFYPRYDLSGMRWDLRIKKQTKPISQTNKQTNQPINQPHLQKNPQKTKTEKQNKNKQKTKQP